MKNIFDKLLAFIFYMFRYRYYKKKYNIKNNFRFNGYFIQISGDGKIIVGNNSYISFYSHIMLSSDTALTIGENVSIAHNVKIYTEGFDTKEFIVNGIKKTKKGNVTIGNNVLIGSNTYINPGITIGDNVFIGANSVVTHDIPSKSLAAGVPAKVIKRY